MKPLIFDGESVRAILAGRKTQTRRVMKPQPTHKLVDGLAHVTVGMNPADDGGVWYDTDCVNPAVREYRPPHPIGSIVWVLETFSLYLRDNAHQLPMHEAYQVWYHADNDRPTWAEKKWRSPIHMPRWAVRLWLRITDVRVQRVQEISDSDALAEGVAMVMGSQPPQHGEPGLPPAFKHYLNPDFNGGSGVSVRHSFRTRWDSINAKRGFGWDTNPWVWAHAFERIEKPEGA